MSKTVIVLVLTTLLASCVALWGWSEASTARGIANEQKELREAAEARLVNIKKATKAVEKKNAEYRVQLDRALEQNRTWSAGPVPDPVRDSLCARANCAAVGAVPSPAD